MNHWAIPRLIWKAMEEEKEQERGRSTKKQMQQKLDFKMMIGPREFTRSGVLHAVAKLVVTNNQPLALADNIAFHNTLVSMRPKLTSSDLPTSYNVKLHVHNEFVKWINQLDITVSLEVRHLRKVASYSPLI
ncbi:hypothetical protein BYT27DRAFT_7125849 [Phlegmacium glaucopus]|nr:hypothetical protein BYT27DRAFT_7125849 [Phlegmacium glaucopus]